MGKKTKVLELGQINEDIIDSWADKFEKRDDGYNCVKCGSVILQTTCYVSIHAKEFDPKCAGSGKVVQHLNYPYCPKCDGDIEFARACYHTYYIKKVPLPMIPQSGGD